MYAEDKKTKASEREGEREKRKKWMFNSYIDLPDVKEKNS
jgi:hypothetical protein